MDTTKKEKIFAALCALGLAACIIGPITAAVILDQKHQVRFKQALSASNANLASLPRTSACNNEGAVVAGSTLNCFDVGTRYKYRIVAGDGYKVFSTNSETPEYLFAVSGPRGDDLIERRNTRFVGSLAMALQDAADASR
jgi:hypothetical protein